MICVVGLLCWCNTKQALALWLRSGATMMQLLILKLEPEHALIVLLDLFHGQDLLILELSILSFEVSCQGNHFIELLVSLSFVAPSSDNLLL